MNTIRVSNSLDPDQARLFVRPDLGPNCLHRLSADDTVFLCAVGKTSPHASIVLIFFHILVLRKYWVLTEHRIPLKPVLGGVIIVALSISSHEQTQ